MDREKARRAARRARVRREETVPTRIKALALRLWRRRGFGERLSPDDGASAVAHVSRGYDNRTVARATGDRVHGKGVHERRVQRARDAERRGGVWRDEGDAETAKDEDAVTTSSDERWTFIIGKRERAPAHRSTRTRAHRHTHTHAAAIITH